MRSILTALLALAFAITPAFAKKIPPAHPIDINTATVKELEQLPGVGPTTAKAIIEFRARAGHFQRVTDLLVIRGISESKLKKMRPYITVGPPPRKPAPAPSPTPAH
jgi:competence protein ComEA